MASLGPQSLVVLADVGGDEFHVGDEAMLDANLALIRGAAPETKVTVLGRSADNDAIRSAVGGADGVLLSGGGNLSDTWPWLVGQRLTLLEEALRRALPVVTGGQTIGPALSDPQRARLIAALAGVTMLGTREADSRALALELGVSPDRVDYQVDDAFGQRGTPPTDGPLLAAVDAPYIAVTLDGSYASQAAALGLRSLAGQLAALAAELRLGLVFVPHLGQLGERAGDDVGAGRRLEQLLRLTGTAIHIAPVLPVSEAAWLSHRAALTISSRYHPLVFASAAAQPCIALHRDAYTRAKLRGALAHVGAEEWCLPTAHAEAGGLLAHTRELWKAKDETCARMHDARPAIDSREAVRQAALLARLGIASPAPDRPIARPERMLRGMSSDATAGDQRTAAPISVRAEIANSITPEQWDQFARDGFLHLGPVLSSEQIAQLTQRADDLAMGLVQNDHVQMQLDTGGAYDELPEAVQAFASGTRMYRKIQGLEMDDLFISLIRHPRFFEACARIYGPHVPVSIFRAMVMNKPAGQGTYLPWHQDGGDVWALDREPLMTIWIALDPATTANGCMEAVRGSHQLGLLSAHGSTVSDEDAAVHCPEEMVVPLEVAAGHAVLLHNWLIHRSGINSSPIPRRAVTVCYLDGRTRSIQTGDHFPVVAGSVDATSQPYVAYLETEVAALREAASTSEEYALSLAAALEATRASHAEAAEYARSLEAERERLTAELAEATATSSGPVRRRPFAR